MNSLESILLRISFLAFIVLLALLFLVAIKPLSFLWFTPYIILSALLTLSTYTLRILVGNKSGKWLGKVVFYPLTLLPLVLYIYVWMLGNDMEDSWTYILASAQLTVVVGIAQKLDFFKIENSKAYALVGLTTFSLGAALSVGFLIPLNSTIYFNVLFVLLAIFSLASIALTFFRKA
ncbi:hypothetical protein SAMN05216474_2017 [Lishizhenia tianjinensis]|uniref:Uncharacterized protein n=1 Tax=Lishizhenia tianjinensis TaxID=477690 RepID=A0A1I7AET7_9FLAO|nr:hypothetical protein [Lishizhenia tianjinensis]SFT73451.1 hypothetical protein SAMN05216474_2017 [Lishizhenia tianjinensis]